MPPPPILDLSSLDVENVVADLAAIQRYNPQRHEFQLLDRVIMFDREQQLFAGYHDVKPDAWWTRAHVPGRPLFPGVLMIESAAQLASYVWHAALDIEDRFLGFAAVDEVKYRGAVVPPCRLLMIGHCTKLTARRTVARIQGYVDSSLMFEATITGMPV